VETAIGEKALYRTPRRIEPARSRPQALATPMALRSVVCSRLFPPGCPIKASPADTFTIPHPRAAACPRAPCRPSGLGMLRLTVSRGPCAARLNRAQSAQPSAVGSWCAMGDPTRGEVVAGSGVTDPAPPAIGLLATRNFLAIDVEGCYTALLPEVIGEGATRLFSDVTPAGLPYRIFPACRTAFSRRKQSHGISG
jgi:hypothetical protein